MAAVTLSNVQCIRIATLPLAVYREIAAHLEQVQGVRAALIWDTHPQFDYSRSQIQSLTFQMQNPEPNAEATIQAILKYYSDRFGQWEILANQPIPGELR